jgi:hypothetical protein
MENTQRARGQASPSEYVVSEPTSPSFMSRMIKNIGIKLGIYDEAFPAFGVVKTAGVS